MQFNNFFFPSPKPQYNFDSFGTNLIFIKSKDRKVPCYMMKGSSKIWIIYFHGNSQDLLGASQFMQQLKSATEKDFNILAIEYPTYGLYKDAEPTEENIQQDAVAAYEYIENTQENAEIYLLGRSMGTGPACYLANLNKGKGLILISAFASFSKIAHEYTGFLGALVKDRFQNVIYAKNITIPTLLIHGQADDIVRLQYIFRINLYIFINKLGLQIRYIKTKKYIIDFLVSISLNTLKLSKYMISMIDLQSSLRSIVKSIYLPPNMTHTKYDMINDISEPLEDFFNLVTNK